MPVFKVEKSKDYTVMSNYHLRDKSLSLKAKGLLSFILSLPDDWDYSLNGLTGCVKEGETAVSSSLDELKKNGYLRIDKIRSNAGKFEYIYNVFEQPTRGIKPGGGFPGVENRTQINTNIINTKINNICSFSPSKEDETNQLADDFDKIWSIYPRKDGKNTAFNHYKAWLKGKTYAGRTTKLTNKQMWYAVKKYSALLEENKVEKQYIKMGSTFFNEAIMEYVDEKDDNES